MRLDTLVGNQALKGQLSRRREPAHAYILAGPRGSGRHTLARLLAAAMVCTGGGERPCGTCSQCRKALAGIHPDLIPVAAEKGKEITVGQARQMRADAYIRPNEGERKVYLIEDAQTMNSSAQNAVLKLLEEGPAYAAFLLLTDNAAALLPTVRSRCETLTLSPVSRREGEQWLRRRFPQAGAEEITAAAIRCGGILGRAAEELSGAEQEDQAVTDLARALLDTLRTGDELRRLELAVGAEKWERARVAALLDALRDLIRDELARPGGQPGDRRRLSAAADQAAQLRAACDCNAAPGHLLGWLAAGLSLV